MLETVSFICLPGRSPCVIVEMSCTFEHLTSETIGSEPRLRYLPVMITRLMLSLKKATASQNEAWSLGEPTVHTMWFIDRQVTTGDEMNLDTFAIANGEAQTQA